MSSTPVPSRTLLRGHVDPLADTPGTAVKKKKVSSTPVHKVTKKKAPESAPPPAADHTPKRPSLDRAVPKTPKNKSIAAAAGGDTTAKKPKRVGAGATPASKKLPAAMKQQPRLKPSSSTAIGSSTGARVSREQSVAAAAVVASPAPVPVATHTTTMTAGASQKRQTVSASPGRSVLSPGSASLLSTSSVGVGRRFQPNAYKRTFAVTGSYSCLECVPQTASIWVGDVESGAIEIYNSLTGHLTTTIPAPGAAGVTSPNAAATSSMQRQDRLAQSTTSQRSAISMVGIAAAGPMTAIGATPTALRATSTHMFVGYSNGTVAIYDFLVLQFITEGRFHTGRVVDLCVLKDGTVVSASDDGALVHWDREATNFEAITRVLAAEGTSEGRMTCIAAATPPSSLRRSNHVVLCGFSSGAILILDVVSGLELQALHGHAKPVLDIAVLGELLFTTADDGAVLVWSNRLGDAPSSTGAFTVAGAGGAQGQRCTLLRRIPVQPAVSAFLADAESGSLWVAFTDGLLERWSAQPDDDFGVEEVVREGMIRPEAGTLLSHRPTRLIAMGAADTLQVLALSSNGVNKVWYGHHNTLEQHLSASIHALDRVIQQDSEDTAAWRERLNILKQKEVERKGKYVVILEQLSELRVLLDYFDRWRQHRSTRRLEKNRSDRALVLETRAEFALTRRYFSRWASFYDYQQRRFRRHLLARSLEDATRRAQVTLAFHRWQAGLVQRRLAQSRLDSVRVMAQASESLLRAKAYYQWRRFTHKRQIRAVVDGDVDETASAGTTVPPLTRQQIDLIAAKAQRQVLARSMAKWQEAAHSRSTVQASRSEAIVSSAMYRYTALMARLRDECVQRSTLQLWRRWVPMRQRRRALAAVSTLRSQQADYLLQQDFYYRWVRFAYAARLRANAKAIEAVQQKLRQAEAEHGDIFEKLQLQKRIDQLIQEQADEERALAARQASLHALRDSCTSLQTHGDTRVAVSAGCDGTSVDHEREASPPAVEPASPASTSASASAGMMVTHADYYNALVDEQRLSPAVLSQMPPSDAIQHVMGQLKANTLNMYTDMPLFRQVKERRRTGTTAAAIFLEAFSEVTRLVSTTSGAAATGAARGQGTSSATPGARWPLCMEALDCIPTHHCATVLTAIKTLVVSFDLLPAEDLSRVANTCEEVVVNADWILLIARACYLRRRPLLPSNNR